MNFTSLSCTKWLVFALVLSAVTQAAARSESLSLELNSVEKSDKGCRLTFVISNSTEQGLDSAGFEMALFDKAGVVDRLTVLSFKDLPAGKTKVSRFDLAGVECTRLGRVLVNASTQCTTKSGSSDICSNQLTTASKIEIGLEQ